MILATKMSNYLQKKNVKILTIEFFDYKNLTKKKKNNHNNLQVQTVSFCYL